MISNLEYLNAPMWVIIIIVLLVVLVEITKGISYLWGVLAPKILKIQTSAKYMQLSISILDWSKRIQRVDF